MFSCRRTFFIRRRWQIQRWRCRLEHRWRRRAARRRPRRSRWSRRSLLHRISSWVSPRMPIVSRFFLSNDVINRAWSTHQPRAQRPTRQRRPLTSCVDKRSTNIPNISLAPSSNEYRQRTVWIGACWWSALSSFSSPSLFSPSRKTRSMVNRKPNREMRLRFCSWSRSVNVA